MSADVHELTGASLQDSSRYQLQDCYVYFFEVVALR
jgi:hypothetical protein